MPSGSVLVLEFMLLSFRFVNHKYQIHDSTVGIVLFDRPQIMFCLVLQMEINLWRFCLE
jgi:hypothetical protein